MGEKEKTYWPYTNKSLQTAFESSVHVQTPTT
jgi:hypothetical protein